MVKDLWIVLGVTMGILEASAFAGGDEANLFDSVASRLKMPQVKTLFNVRGAYLHCIWTVDGAVTFWGEKEWLAFMRLLKAANGNIISVFLWPIDRLGQTHILYSGDPETQKPETKRRVELYRRLISEAHSIRLSFMIGWSVNAATKGIAGKHPEWKAQGGAELGGEGCLLCPSIPEARRILLDIYREQAQLYFEADRFFLCGLDLGGCQCERCRPWWKTTASLVADHQRMLKEIGWKGELVFITWFFPPEEIKSMLPLLPKDIVLWVQSHAISVIPEVRKAGFRCWVFPELDMEPQMEHICPLPDEIVGTCRIAVEGGAEGVVGFIITPKLKLENFLCMMLAASDPKVKPQEALLKSLQAIYGDEEGERLLPIYQALSDAWRYRPDTFVPLRMPFRDIKASAEAATKAVSIWRNLKEPEVRFPLLSKTIRYIERTFLWHRPSQEEVKASSVNLGEPESERDVILAGGWWQNILEGTDSQGKTMRCRVVSSNSAVYAFLKFPRRAATIRLVFYDDPNFVAHVSVFVNGQKVGEFMRGVSNLRLWQEITFAVPEGCLNDDEIQEVRIAATGAPFGISFIGFEEAGERR